MPKDDVFGNTTAMLLGRLMESWYESERFRVRTAWLIETFGNLIGFRHGLNTRRYAYQLAKSLGASEYEALEVGDNTFLHDLGKEHPHLIGYFKRDDTWTTTRLKRLNKAHCGRGPEVLDRYSLNGMESGRASTKFVQKHHHSALKEVPHCSFDQRVHLVRVVDHFDAMTCPGSERPYRLRQSFNLEKAAEELVLEAYGRKLEEKTVLAFITRVLELDLNFNCKVIMI